MAKDISQQEILDAINVFSAHTDKQFSEIKGEIAGMKATMVTRDYLDDKLADLRGDLVVLTRKEDVKVKKLVEILKKRKLISDEEVKEIMAMEPFPQTVL
jgi:hypothetical protein